jgi:formylglycine-generating enzyme required for sulfatase activity
MNRTLTLLLLILAACSVKQAASESNQTVKNNNASHAQDSVPGPSATAPQPQLSSYEFETVTVNSRGEIVNRRKGQARYYREDIGGVSLDMVELKGGSFMMGSTELPNEQPVHEVTVPPFFIGKYEVTQDQWRAVARLPRADRELNPDPSHFKGGDLPVERVSWDDAMEFCARLSRATGRNYSLPSGAQWEYACRAGTTTAFAFGENITPELVNYNGNVPYKNGANGTARGRTLPVGSLGAANGFGLYDMHGNVEEWCLDREHWTYVREPTDGSPFEGNSLDGPARALRGGSWEGAAYQARSAARGRDIGLGDWEGFRIVGLTQKSEPGRPAEPKSTELSGAFAPPPDGLPLRDYQFVTVILDSTAAIVSRRQIQARYFAEDTRGLGLEMVAIPGGSFTMGSSEKSDEQPPHRVSVPPFYLGKYEVTQKQWRAVAQFPRVRTYMNPRPSHFKGDNLPVEQVSWEEAMEFCARLSRATRRTYRLPTEAEWEFACRGGTTTEFALGEDINPDLVNYDGNNPYGGAPKGTSRERTTPVGSLGVANEFGLYDMVGNVWEWCLDSYHDSYFGSTRVSLRYDPAPSDGSAWEASGYQILRVTRGGSWFHFAKEVRSAARSSVPPDFRQDDIGFRVVAEARTR